MVTHPDAVRLHDQWSLGGGRMTAVELGGMLADLLREHRVPGAVVGVVDADGGTRVVTVGTRGDGRGPVGDGTMFRAASLSKPVFAFGVMSLVDAGALELDRPLIEYGGEPYLPDDKRAVAITARMVLSHTTGFPNWRESGPLFLRWAPGTRWGYSGEGYAYLQRVVEHVTGVGLDEYMTDAVLRPLGMHDSNFAFRVDDGRVAVGHDHEGKPRPRLRVSAAKAAAGGMYTTATDYLRFVVHALVHGRAMFEPQVWIDDDLAWGLGWGIEHRDRGRAVWQWGNDPGYKNFVIALPGEQRGVVVFTNGDRGALVYRDVVRALVPGAHASLDTRLRPRWLLAKAQRPADLTSRLDEPAVRALLVDDDAAFYRRANRFLFGLVVEPSWEAQGIAPGTPIACIGLDRRDDRREAVITSLTVSPRWRGQGFARALLFDVCAHLDLRAVEVESEADNAGFWRACGFTVEHRDERLHCRLELPPR